MPLHIMNETLYHDRTVQDWHRRAMPKDAYCMDLDLLGYCHVVGCRAPLYGIEATTRTNKVTTVLERMCRDGGFFGLVVVYEDGAIVDYEIRYAPKETKLPRKPTFDADKELALLLKSIRRLHAEHAHSALTR